MKNGTEIMLRQYVNRIKLLKKCDDTYGFSRKVLNSSVKNLDIYLDRYIIRLTNTYLMTDEYSV